METTSATRPLRKRPRPLARYAGSKAGPATVCTAGTATDGFLSHNFAPLYQPADQLPDRTIIERDFFKSRSYLKKHYQLQLTNYRPLPYPCNILLAQRELAYKLKTKGRHRELLITGQENNRVCLTVKETLSYAVGLYYIPVMPIYKLWQQAENQPCAELLTAVCTYLYQQARIPYYRDEGSYLCYNYEILEDWLEDGRADLADEYNQQKNALAEARLQGDFLKEKMTTGCYKDIERPIAGFQVVTGFERDCLKIAEACRNLQQACPDADFYRHAALPDGQAEDYEDNCVAMDEYVGFVASNNDLISESLMDMVTSDFNERDGCQELKITTVFNGPRHHYQDGLAYGCGVFELIDNLCTLLNRLT